MTIKAPPKVELDVPAFEEFARARTGLIELLGIEERFNMVLENYAEFETELLRQSLHHMMFDDLEWVRFAAVIHTFSRRLNNLLSTCRLYLDQTPSALNRIYGNDDTLSTTFRTLCAAEYDAVFAYRVMEAIRNYSQHRNLPVEQVSVQNGEFPGFEEELNHHLVVPSLDVDELRRDGAFKASVQRELDALGNRYMDIRMLVRQYVEALGRVHANVQSAVSADLNEWDALMARLRSQFESLWDGAKWSYVQVICKTPEGDMKEGFVVEAAVQRRISLSRRNRNVVSYSRQVVSNFAGAPM